MLLTWIEEINCIVFMLRSLLHLVMFLYNAQQWSSRLDDNIYIWFCSWYNGSDSTSMLLICCTSIIQSINVDFWKGFNSISFALTIYLNFFRRIKLFVLWFVFGGSFLSFVNTQCIWVISFTCFILYCENRINFRCINIINKFLRCTSVQAYKRGLG